MTTWRGGRAPGAERGECGRGESEEREEEQVPPLIVGQISGAGHTWLLPGSCGVELRQNPNNEYLCPSTSTVVGWSGPAKHQAP